VRWLSASEAAQRVRNGELNPQDVVQAHLEAIDRYDSRIHAYIHVDRNARSSSGMTLAVKDAQPVAGMPYTYGTASWRDRIADEDAVGVARARSAGMAILGKTNTPELAASIGTVNTLFPPTQNPWRQRGGGRCWPVLLCARRRHRRVDPDSRFLMRRRGASTHA
jgi:Asp-tRNA(Asn)/Glu-tRNA(Gln) amidotransferase A subunit family amidase